MAVAIDQTNVGTHAAHDTNVTFATANAVASGAHIVLLAFRFNNSGGTTSVSGGGLTWTQAHTATSGSLRLSLFYAYAASGLASGTNITVSGTAASSDWTIVASSYTGIDSATPTTGAVNAAAAGTAAWSSGSVTATSGNTLIGGAGGDGTLRTSTPTSPAVERQDFNSATTAGSVTLVDKIGVGAGSNSLAGTWSGTLDHIGIVVEFTAAAGGGGGATVRTLASLGAGK